ncbi:serine hydrolase [Luteimonas kalidii]|uniref:Serine hydrolase n=1 Tax=Luteimonas kalidii TaxID=3042025 RepID=A0ABT6JS87_9GAMM|nr:serine hydrolase [Luteimonas kalidii]MDH5833553.1 serine hydrolase [Luteimonas kalidii]
MTLRHRPERRLRRLAAVLLACVSATQAAHAAPATTVRPARETLDAIVDDAIARYQPPGLAVAVIVDGEVVYTRTHGERVAGTGEAIDRDTLFKIASNSKAMTAALLARLVDQGKLAWTDPVVRHLPGFRMHDDWVTREMQVRDLLIHNSGLGAGAGDLMLWPGPNRFTRADVIRGLQHLEPVYSFRSRYAYDNTLYIVAGEVAAAAGGAPYDVLMRREVFAPLGMDRCQAGQWRRDEVGNLAQPHANGEAGAPVAVGLDAEVVPDVPMMAAGGLRCSLDDMLRWTRMWLRPEQSGLDAEGRPWLSRAQREEVWTAHMPMPLTTRMREWDDSHFSAYGYGWRLTDVDGTWKVSHTGTLSGMYSALTLLPQLDVGFVVLINGNADELRTVLTQALVKGFTRPGEAGLDVAHYAALLARERAARPAEDREAALAQPRTGVAPDEMASLTGRYRDPWFGDITICGDGARVEFRSAMSPRLHGTVMRSGSRLLVDWTDPGVDAEAWLDFARAGGQGTRLSMAKVDPEADFSYDYEDLDFERVDDCTTP